ncbi:hypothetical protein dsat_2122 [Alkalidesulfovibrio alkalitolerans DSM 16529]|jgi:hypothetical protein|uniref:PA2779 family protein n=1 Tax=Alkalidesulfovibrio alkalitolerans DSM 16529 TaxID=1121439 RepID=S7TFA4_9BACT|nr:PA2779 family protein [Alkalidesulfovibrio alkalitolerans]EPR35421.1 hypothetical protein dsat_2122 [Alkalidesulfovibrio alkalitolerans DSM 16529]
MKQLTTFAWFKPLTMCMALIMFTLGLVPRVEASFLPTGESRSLAAQEADMSVVREALENKIVGQRLADFGYTAEEVENTLKLASPEEIHQLATNIQAVQAGEGALGVIIAILVIALLVVLILHFSGKTVTIQ